MHLRTALVALFIFTATAFAQEISDTQGKILNLQTETTLNGGTGLINLQTLPGNPMGTLGISLHGLFLQHDYLDVHHENVGTGMFSLTYSLTGGMETYFSGSYVVGLKSSTPTGTFTTTHLGLGSQELGVKLRFPLKRAGVLEAGMTAGIVMGTAENKVAGFNYLNTRRMTDVKLRLIQTLRLQDHGGFPNLHFNEGYITEQGPAPDLFTFGLGLDYLLHRRWQFIAEFNSWIEERTPVYLNENYMAVTTALRYFTPAHLSLDLGANFGLSKNRWSDDSWRRTDPWQVFVGITFTPRVNTADQDNDGIPDWLDAEINMPANYPHDSYGQLLDTDGDGVPDVMDKEPSTQHGAVVDKNGVALDDDGDGVPNGLDRETRTPKGAWVDANGVAYDTDRDGVPDGLDQEPNTMLGALVDQNGVAKDSDHDGVPDGIDQEANTPPDALVDAWGRSIPAPSTTPPQANLVGTRTLERLEASLMKLPNLHFDIDKSNIKPEDYSTLDIVGQMLSDYPALVILIEGHADITGTPAHNLELSFARARAVRDYLIVHYPKLTRANFTVTGMGKEDPLVENSKAEGRTQNRRVEFKILNREQLQEMITTWE
jgi:outer membrane protein OmpA-like peptidoglycan-associated protein